MKTRIYLNFATGILITVLGVSADAQTRNQQHLRIQVPFAFNVGNTSLPAGAYDVSVVNPTVSRSVLRIASLDGHSNAMIQATDVIGVSTANAKLMFRHYGKEYFLAQVWMAAEATGLATPTSDSEKTISRHLGKASNKYDVVAVNAR